MTSPQVSPQTPADPWFETLIAQCLAGLYLLNLEGCPAADSVAKTGHLWTRLLWDDRRVQWHQQADAARIRAAFASMAASVSRWPAPARFWDHLPPRPKPKPGTAIDADWGRERQAEALRLRDDWLESLGRDASGNIIKGHPNAPAH